MHFLWQHPQIGKKMGSKSEKLDFFNFFNFYKGILAKLNDLESESDILPQYEGQSWQIWIYHA